MKQGPAPITAAASTVKARRLPNHLGGNARTLLVSGVLLAFIAHASGLFKLALNVAAGSANRELITSSPEFAMLVTIGIVLAAGLPRLRPIQASLLTLLMMMPVMWLGYARPAGNNVLPMEYSLLTILVMFSVNVLAAYLAEAQQRQRLLEAFNHFVPPEVVARIMRGEGGLTLEAESRELSVMFCDIHGFSGISESLEPKQLASLLNTLLTPLTGIIYKHGGVVDKYLGDGVMAFWGAPLDDPQHAGNSLLAAFEIQEALATLRPQFESRGWPPIRMGIGINTGMVSVGNMGSSYRVAYTAVGDSVNLASRLQDLTRLFSARIIVGEGTQHAFPSATYRELGLVKVRGKEALVRIYEPCNPATDPESTIVANMHKHNQALRHYYAREWGEAEKLFGQLKRSNPEDTLYDYYLDRIDEFRVTPPARDWRGELRFTVR